MLDSGQWEKGNGFRFSQRYLGSTINTKKYLVTFSEKDGPLGFTIWIYRKKNMTESVYTNFFHAVFTRSNLWLYLW